MNKPHVDALQEQTKKKKGISSLWRKYKQHAQ